jgi:CBS domain-containing protein
MEKEAADPQTEFWMAIVGPITSAALGAILMLLARAAGWTAGFTPKSPGTALLVWLGYINFALAIFNLIPGFPLDGGRVLRAILWWAMDSVDRATRAAARVGQIIAALFIGYGVLRFFTGADLGGLWLAFIGWFLLQAASASYVQVRAGTLLGSLQAKDLMSRDFGTVDADVSLEDFLENYLMRTGRRCFFVFERDRLVGLITGKETAAVDAKLRPFKRVADVMRDADRIHLVSPETSALEALETMAREDVNQLPVVSDGRVAGIVTRGKILSVLRLRTELAGRNDLPRAA